MGLRLGLRGSCLVQLALFLKLGPFPGLPGPAVGPQGLKIGLKPGAGFIIQSSLSPFVRFSAIDVTKPYKFAGFGPQMSPNPIEFIRFGAPGCRTSKPQMQLEQKWARLEPKLLEPKWAFYKGRPDP